MSFDLEKARRDIEIGAYTTVSMSLLQHLTEACDEIERLRANAFCARSGIDWCIGYAASVPEPDALRRQLRSARAHLTDDAEAAT